MGNTHENKMVKRLNATLPDPLALYVAEMTGKGALYETPSEFIRDLVRRHMERTQGQERREIHALLEQAMSENDYADLTADDFNDARRAASD